MRFIEISQPLVTRLENILESKEGKNTHLEHLEDNIFNKGYTGAKEAVDYLYSIHQMLEGHADSHYNMTLKWDGAPAIIAGRDPASGKFFVGTKGVFAKGAKLNFTPADIERNHADVGDKDGSGLRNKLNIALRKLKGLNWDTVAQGDMLFTKEDLKSHTIDNEQLVLFKPNTVAYAAPVDSKVGQEILSSDMGIVWHTEYVGGPTLADTKAKFGFDSSRLGKAAGVWSTDATIKDLSGTVTLTAEENAAILNAIAVCENYLTQIDRDTFTWLEQGNDLVGKEFLQQLKKSVNDRVRMGDFGSAGDFAKEFTNNWISFKQKKIDTLKTQSKIDQHTAMMVDTVKFIKQHVRSITAVYDLYLKLIQAKNLLVNKLNVINSLKTFAPTADGYEVIGGEGFVAIDRMGNALKLVDRLEFSKLNFQSGKPGAK